MSWRITSDSGLNIVTISPEDNTLLFLTFTVVVRKPAWVEDDDEGGCAPVPTFQSAFTEALDTADWSKYEANSAEQGNAKLGIVVTVCREMFARFLLCDVVISWVLQN